MSLPNSQFATTQWTLVWRAAQEDSNVGKPALAEIIKCYWHPLYSYARKNGLSSENAEDATQEFLAGVIDGRLIKDADPAKGKFRTFLLTAWKRFLIDTYRKQNAAKRGGGDQICSIEVGEVYLQLHSREEDPERLFMLSWASSLLAEVKQRLRKDYIAKNKQGIFDELIGKLTTPMRAESYSEAARRVGLSEGATKVALHRLRHRFGETLREVVAETIDPDQDIDQEISELLSVLKTRRT